MNNFEEVLRLKNSREWIEFDRYCNTGTLEQISFFRYENVHTNFLKGLFENDNVFGLGTKPLKLFIELLKVKDNGQIKNKFKHDLLDKYYISNLEVFTQRKISVGTLDLLIQFNIDSEKYNIILENKLFSEESSDDQTKRYKDCVDKEYNDANNIYVLLSLDNTTIISAGDEYIRVDYQELINYVIEPCSFLEIKGYASLSIEEYLKGFTYLCEFDCMPITSNLRKLAVNVYNEYPVIIQNILNLNSKEHSKFYNNNKKQFRILFTVLKEEKTIDPVIKSNINKTIFGNLGRFKGKDYSCREQTKMVHDILLDLISTNTITKLEEINKLQFSDRSSWKVTITKSQYDAIGNRQENYIRDNNLKVENEILYYCYPTTKDELKGFTQCVIKKYPNYEKKITINY